MENPPKTYSEFLKAAAEFHTGYRWLMDMLISGSVIQKFLSPGGRGFLISIHSTWPLRVGAKLVDNEKVVFNNEHAIEVFDFLKTLYDKNYFTREYLSARQDVFLSGIIATRFTGPWEIIRAEKFKKDDFYYHFSTIPVPDNHTGPVYTYGDPKNIVIFNTCKDPNQAWKFINVNDHGAERS